MIASFRHFLKDRRANSATEFAFILPVMLLFIAGIVEFGRVIQAYNEVDRLSSRFASAYSDCNNTPIPGGDQTPCGTELNYYSNATVLKNMAPQLSNGSLVVRMAAVTYTPTGTGASYYWTGTQPTAAELQAAQSTIYTPGTQQNGVICIVTYTQTLNFFPSLIQQFLPAAKLAIRYAVAQRST